MDKKRLSSKLKNLLDNNEKEDDARNYKKMKIDHGIYINEKELLNLSQNRLKNDFFNQNCIELSKNLLGKYLIRVINVNSEQKFLIGKIVECEAYLGGNDQASHSFNDKKTERNEAMFMKPGTIYVYNIYGIYCCLNISSKENGSGVLIRALEPIYGIDLMKEIRKPKKDLKTLTNGPSKLCMSFKIIKNEFNKEDLETNKFLWIQDRLDSIPAENFKIIKARRIGIDYAGDEAINKLYRFYIKDNKFVSVKCKNELEEII